jgi:hypothetical protein
VSGHERLSPRERQAVNDALIRREQEDPANWRSDPVSGSRYYVGPRMEGDGSIDWSDGDGWPVAPPEETT